LSRDDATRRDFTRYAAEMRQRGITAEWRIIEPAKMDWHDRFILGRRQAWNVPPVNTLFKGDYSEASRTPKRPPFETSIPALRRCVGCSMSRAGFTRRPCVFRARSRIP
jgi:hypothetical protein